MKSIFLLSLTLTAVCFAEPAGGSAIGRYQLFAATVQLDGVSTATVFKIDTQTGQVWRFVQLKVAELSGGTHIDAEGITKVSADINEAINEAKELVPSAKRAVEAQRSPRE